MPKIRVAFILVMMLLSFHVTLWSNKFTFSIMDLNIKLFEILDM